MKKKLLTTFTALIAAIALLMGLAACGTTEYEIKFAAEDGTTLLTLTVEEGEAPVFTGETPTKAQTPQYTYTFAGWKDADGVVYSSALPAATANATYTAAFTQTGRTYTVKWSVNGTETSKTLAYGAAVAYDGAAPTKANTAQYTYAFAGWNDGEKTYGPAETLPTVSKDVTYTAEFTSTVNSYTVTWHVGSQTSTSTVEYGAKAVYGETEPAKAQTESTVYAFAGWAKTENGDVLDEDLTVTGDVDLYAVFTESVRRYTITWNIEGQTSTTQVAYDARPVYDGTPEKAATAQYSYTFAGWQYDGTTYGPTETLPQVRSDMTFTAQFTSTVNQYTVTWDVDGQKTTAKFDYGTVPAYEGTPEKADTPEYSYVFDGWAATAGGDKLATLPAVTGDVTYYARFTQTDRQFTVTWNVDGKTTTTRVVKGQHPVWSEEDPTKERDAQYTYTFSGWATSAGSEEIVTLAEQTITADTTYYAVFSKTVNEYTIKFVVEGEETSTTMEYGAKPSYNGGTDPSKEETVSTTYTFEGWNDGETTYKTGAEIPTVTGDATYTAIFTETTRQYTITVKHYNGLEGTTTLKADTTLTLDYGTVLTAENSAITAVDDGGKHYLPNMFRLGGIVTENKEVIVRYTEADIWDGSAKSESLTGQGTADQPFLIQSAEDLYYLSTDSYNTNNYGQDKYYKLTTSIDLADHPWQPICYNGGAGSSAGWKYFAGNFDGGGHTIAGLYFNDGTKDGVGLFACVHNGEIKDLTVQGSLTSKTRAGGLVYFADGEKLTNIKTFVDMTVNGSTGEVYSGGVIGTSTSGTSIFTGLESYGTLITTGKRLGGILGNTGASAIFTFTDCANYGNVTGGTHISGIVGYNEKSKTALTGCVNYGNITATTQRAAGIIATIQGGTSATLTNCKNYGIINTPAAGGGIVGAIVAPANNDVSGVSISGSENHGKVTATKQAGGIVGALIKENNAKTVSGITVSNCTNYAEVAGNNHVGGIFGETITVNVTECVNYGDVKGTMEEGDYKGFAGIVGWTTTSSNVTGCENHGNIEGNTNTGGICGYLGKGSTCPVEGENANTSDGTVKGNSAKGDIIGYNGNG